MSLPKKFTEHKIIEETVVYAVEIFQPDFTYRSNIIVADIDVELDYLDISKNKIQLKQLAAFEGDYIRIYSSDMTINGIITSTVTDSDGYITIAFKSFMDIFDVDILIDTTELATVTMESFIASRIAENFISNADLLQNIYGLSVSVLTGTADTSLYVEENIVNFYKDIVYSAFLQYNIVIDFNISASKKKIICTIKKNVMSNLTIEADLPNILDKKIMLGVSKESYNKLIAVNSADESEAEIYYLHSDNSISTTDEDRVTPINFLTVYVSASGEKTFSDMAYEKAVSVLTQNEYNNLIELEMTNMDSLINPTSLKIGQATTIINNGISYQSVLTGRVIGKTTTLIFGAIRRELTKKIKWGY